MIGLPVPKGFPPHLLAVGIIGVEPATAWADLVVSDDKLFGPGTVRATAEHWVRVRHAGRRPITVGLITQDKPQDKPWGVQLVRLAPGEELVLRGWDPTAVAAWQKPPAGMTPLQAFNASVQAAMGDPQAQAGPVTHPGVTVTSGVQPGVTKSGVKVPKGFRTGSAAAHSPGVASSASSFRFCGLKDPNSAQVCQSPPGHSGACSWAVPAQPVWCQQRVSVVVGNRMTSQPCALTHGHAGPCASASIQSKATPTVACRPTTTTPITTTTTAPWSAKPDKPLDVVNGTEALTGYKQAWLRLDPHGVRVHGPVKTEIAYTVETVALCASGFRHLAPDPGCSCGLYALKDPADIESSGYSGNLLLKVDLLGTVIEGTKGFRAERQRIVAGVLEQRDCAGWLCDATPAALAWCPEGDYPPTARLTTPDVSFAPLCLCAAHASRFDPLRVLSMADLTARLGFEIRFATPTAVEAVDDLNRHDPRFGKDDPFAFGV